VLFTPAVIKPAKDLTGPEKVVCAMVFTSLRKDSF
jgi:hypothetical protein